MTNSLAGAPVVNSLDSLFQKCREEKRAALILFLTSGFPNAETTEKLLPVMAEAGCDLIELGVPFSDPIADGPVIQKASTIALEAGMSFPKTLDILRHFRQAHQTPVILFGALNPYLRRGLENSARLAKEAGAQGILAADLPVDESDEFREILNAHDMHLITLLAPTTPDERLKQFVNRCSGFLYCIAYKGTTGTGQATQAETRAFLTRLRKHLDLPLALGFGIRTPADVRSAVDAGADAIVVGSALVSLIEDAIMNGRDAAAEVSAYVRSLAAELKKN